MSRKALLMLIAMVSPISAYSELIDPYDDPEFDPYAIEECLESKIDIKYRLCDIQAQIDRHKLWQIDTDVWTRTRAMKVELWRKEVNSRLDNIEGCLTED